MQPKYLALLSESVQHFIQTVESGSGVEIEVVLDPKQNSGGTTGQGKLAIEINAQKVQLFAPTNGYFPNGAVRHEVLHVERFHIDKVPKLVLAEKEDWDMNFSVALGNLDNAIEHLVIVPQELKLHPERREHWEKVMRSVCLDLPDAPEGERSLAVCLHWTFFQHVLTDSLSKEIAKDFAEKHGLLEMANQFAHQFISALTSKEELVRLLCLTFPVVDKNRAALEYINSLTGTHQKPIS